MVNKTHIQQLRSYVSEDPIVYLRVVLISIFIGFLEFIGVSSLLPVVSVFLGNEDVQIPSFLKLVLGNAGIEFFIVIFFILIVLQTALSLINEFYFLEAMVRWRTELSVNYIKNILRAKFSNLTQLRPGEIEVIITRNIGFAMKIRHRTAIFISDSILAFCYVLIAFYISAYTFALFMFVGFVYFFINRNTIRLKMKYSGIAKEKYINAARLITEYFSDAKSLFFYPHSIFISKVKSELHEAGKVQEKNDKINSLIKNIHQPVMLLSIVIAILMSKAVELENATIMIMLYIFYRAAPKMIEVARGYGDIIGDSPSDVTPDIKKWKDLVRTNLGSTLPEADCSIQISGGRICFGKDVLLDELNLSLAHCSLSVIVGKSGSGKSTLLDVLCGFHNLAAGELHIGGLKSDELDFERFLQCHVALVKPESVIVSGSIAENIAYLSYTIDRKRVESLTRQLKLDEFLDERAGIDTYIDARGANLSAGQRQRIVIARALYKRPMLLLLDEPTSNLDRKTEQDVNDLIAELKGKMTVLIVSHRRGIISLADSVYRIEEKRMVPLERIHM